MFIDLLGFGLIIPILPIYSEQLGASGWMIGLIAGSYSLMQFIFAPIWGNLSDIFGRKPILMASIAINIAGYIFFANATSITLLLLSRSFSGIGSANISVAQAYISDITPPEKRAKSFGLIGVAFGLGFILGPPFGGFLKEYYGIAALGYTASTLSLINFLFVFFMLEESFTNRPESSFKIINPFQGIIDGFRMPIVSEIMTITIVYITAFSMMHVTASLLWENQYDKSEAEIGYIFAFIGLAVVIVQGSLVGPATKRYGEKNLLRWGCIFMAFGLASMPFVPISFFFPLMFISLMLIALGNGFATPSINSLLSQAVEPQVQGKYMGINQSLGSLGRVIGPIIGAAMYDMYYHSPYILAGIMMIGCFLLTRRIPKPFS
jgi:multidrug resistance protein